VSLHVLIAVCLLALCTCGAETRGGATVESRAESIVYGDDDRRDVFETDLPFAQIAQQTAVALLAPSQLRELPSGDYAIDAQAYGELQTLCPGERFAEQPAAAGCSGVLIAPDIVATAAHCLSVRSDGSPDCTNNRYVLGFGVTDPNNTIEIHADNIYDCKGVLGRVTTPNQSVCRYDFALLQLERAVPQAAIAEIRARPVEQGEPLVVVGFPAGLPVKIDRGAQVIEARTAQGDYFTLDSDTFAVSSGSGVFDSPGQLVGLFARGRRDYDQDGSCQRVHHESLMDAASFEEATHIASVQALLGAVRRGQAVQPSFNTSCTPSEYAELTAEPPGRSRASSCAVGGIGMPAHGRLILCLLILIAIRRKLRVRHGLWRQARWRLSPRC
jgi:V8-like Glu-specific endopeptidase